MFGNADITVKILERYELSGQYNPETLMGLYKDSILFELRNYSMLEYNLFRGAKISFPESNVLKMELTKTTLGEDAADELIRILYKIFTERCGLDVKIRVEFVDKKEEKKRRSGRADVEKQAEALNAAMWAAKQAADAAESAENAESADGKIAAAGGAGSPDRAKVEKKTAAKADGGKKNFGNFGKSEYAYGKTLRSGGGFRSRGASNNPDVLYGRDFDDSEITDLVQVIGEMGEVVIHGQVTGWDEREIRGEKTIVTITVTDYTDTIRIKIFEKNDEMEAFREKVKQGSFIKLKGLTAMDRFDNELTISSVTGIKKSSDFRTPRTDNSELKRVELHCHTKMSDMDGRLGCKEHH